MRADVERAPATQPVAPAPPPAPAVAVESDHTDQPATKARSLVAARLTESKATVPHFYLRGRLLALREELNTAATVKISVNDLATRDLAQRAHDGALKLHELQGGTITVSNLGMFGTEEFAAIINPPQSAILAVGAAKPDVVVSDRGKPVVATTMRVTLSVDHRAIDGALAARWMATFIDLVEKPLTILAA